jgi:LPXTG-site transpeptidase (sortase) family protein
MSRRLGRALLRIVAVLALSSFSLALLWLSVQFVRWQPVQAQLGAWLVELKNAPRPAFVEYALTPLQLDRGGQSAPAHIQAVLAPAELAGGSPSWALALQTTASPPIPATGTNLPGVDASLLSVEPARDGSAAPAAPDTPVIPTGELVIPALQLDQALVPVRVESGTWNLDALGDQVGWLETTGTHPQDDLAMVIAGHVTLPAPGGPGPFLNLRELAPGDEVFYRTSEELFVYQVEDIQQVQPDEVQALYVRGGDHLVLVTCTRWNYVKKAYERRLLVNAVLVRTERIKNLSQ